MKYTPVYYNTTYAKEHDGIQGRSGWWEEKENARKKENSTLKHQHQTNK